LFSSSIHWVEQILSQVSTDALHSHSTHAIPSRVSANFHSLVHILVEPRSGIFPSEGRRVYQPFNVPLYLAASITNDVIELSLHYDEDLFVEGNVRYLLNHLVAAIPQVFKNPRLASSELDLISDGEKNFLLKLPSLVEANNLPPPENHSLYRWGSDLLARSVKATPDAVAIEYEGKALYTYAELDAASNKLSRYLTEHLSVQPGEIVVIFAESSPFVVVSIYAVLKAGAAYMPLDVEMPPERLIYAVEMVKSKTVLTISSLEDKLEPFKSLWTVVAIDSLESQWMSLNEAHFNADRFPKEPVSTLAYVNLTSGSSGTPKVHNIPVNRSLRADYLQGCMISHYNLVSFIVEATPCYEVDNTTRQLQVTDFVAFSVYLPSLTSY
jgi:non-ribosomal peptide synthetase component F